MGNYRKDSYIMEGAGKDKTRFEFIDMSKGLAMACIILGHYYIGCYPMIRRIIYPFHVPIFFLISGFFLKRAVVRYRPGIFIRKKAKALLFPYVFSCVVMIVIAIIQDSFWRDFKDIPINVFQLICSSIYGGGVKGAVYPMGYEYNWIGALWFLPALFEALVLTYLIVYFVENWAAQILCVFSMMVIGILSATCIPFQIPFALASGMTTVIYVYIGFLVSKSNLESNSNVKSLLVGLMGMAGWYVAVRYHLIPSCAQAIYGGSIGKIVITIICSIVVSFSITIIMKWYSYFLERPGVLEYIGRNSMIVMCVHAIELRIVNWSKIFKCLSRKFGIEMSYKEQVMFRVFFIGTVTIIAVNFISCIRRKADEKN